jgi:hypothetical protein
MLSFRCARESFTSSPQRGRVKKETFRRRWHAQNLDNLFHVIPGPLLA